MAFPPAPAASQVPPSRPSGPRRRPRTLAALSAGLVLLSACGEAGNPSDRDPEYGVAEGIARNAPISTVDPARLAQLRDLPATYPAPSGSARGTGAASLSLSSVRGGNPYRQGAAGISFESTDLADRRLSADNADMVSYLGTLNGPTLRFGGNSTDRRFFFTDRGEKPPKDWKLAEGESVTTVTPQDLERVAGLAEAVNAKVIVSVDLGHHDPARAARLARAAHEAFGERLVGVMVGNEPNGFYQGKDNPLTIKDRGWNPDRYSTALGQYAAAMRKQVPGLRLVVPGAYDATWWNAAIDTPGVDPMVVAVHQYPLSECGSRQPDQKPTVANAVSTDMRSRVDRMLREAAGDAQDARSQMWITETSLSACSGSNQITQSLAAGVFQAGYTARAQDLGARRIAAHSAMTACEGGPPMSVVCSSGTIADPGDAFSVRANGLALSLMGTIPDGSIHRMEGKDPDLTGFVIDHGRTSATVVITDKRDPARKGPRRTTVRLPFAVDSARQSQLRGPDWEAQFPTASLFEDVPGTAPSGGRTAGEDDAAASAPGYPSDPHVALSAEQAVRQLSDEDVSVDGYGLPITPVAQRPAVAGIEKGSRSVTVSLPAGSATVLSVAKTRKN